MVSQISLCKKKNVSKSQYAARKCLCRWNNMFLYILHGLFFLFSIIAWHRCIQLTLKFYYWNIMVTIRGLPRSVRSVTTGLRCIFFRNNVVIVVVFSWISVNITCYSLSVTNMPLLWPSLLLYAQYFNVRSVTQKNALFQSY